MEFLHRDQSQKRVYCCFICGTLHDDYKKFADHIVELHEEGREYLLCPLTRCQAPVRDLIAHFRAKHPADRLPDGLQHRATIFYDVKHPQKRRKLPTFENGTLISGKNGGMAMHYRSSWEKDVYLCLESMPDVLKYYVEPLSVEYWFKGKKKHYFPDIMVYFVDGSIEVWEVKPSKQKAWKINESKWNACKLYCKLRGWKFEVITEQRIRELKQEVKRIF